MIITYDNLITFYFTFLGATVFANIVAVIFKNLLVFIYEIVPKINQYVLDTDMRFLDLNILAKRK